MAGFASDAPPLIAERLVSAVGAGLALGTGDAAGAGEAVDAGAAAVAAAAGVAGEAGVAIPAAASSLAMRLVFSSACAVSCLSWASSASIRVRRSATGVVAPWPGAGLAATPGVVSGAKNLPSPPGNTVRWMARISDSIRRTRASIRLSCALTGNTGPASTRIIAVSVAVFTGRMPPSRFFMALLLPPYCFRPTAFAR